MGSFAEVEYRADHQIYSESKSSERANTLAAEIISAIREIAGI
ncbi:MAG: hypothetical protein NTY07_05775 [Bacteroidia bacterium]|nr:hypothetical protein [Bacteroidia bacterium]